MSDSSQDRSQIGFTWKRLCIASSSGSMPATRARPRCGWASTASTRWPAICCRGSARIAGRHSRQDAAACSTSIACWSSSRSWSARCSCGKRKDGPVASRRLSPKRGTLLDLFHELVYFTRAFPHPNLTIEAVLVEIEEWRYPGHGRRRRWRKNDFVVADQRLVVGGRERAAGAARRPGPAAAGPLAARVSYRASWPPIWACGAGSRSASPTACARPARSSRSAKRATRSAIDGDHPPSTAA